ncbi:MAG: hypothetical protein AB7P49_20260, partial [Bdellovibrionales bacterium]
DHAAAASRSLPPVAPGSSMACADFSGVWIGYGECHKVAYAITQHGCARLNVAIAFGRAYPHEEHVNFSSTLYVLSGEARQSQLLHLPQGPLFMESVSSAHWSSDKTRLFLADVWSGWYTDKNRNRAEIPPTSNHLSLHLENGELVTDQCRLKKHF